MKLKSLFLFIALVLLSGCVQKEAPELERPGAEEPEGWTPDGVVGDGEYFGSAVL